MAYANSADPDQVAPKEQSDPGLHCLHMAYANSADPDQVAPKEQSDPGLHCLHMPFCPKDICPKEQSDQSTLFAIPLSLLRDSCAKSKI